MPSTRSRTSTSADIAGGAPTNSVLLVGTISAVTIRSDAEGQETAVFRISVEHPAGGRDTIDCETTKRALINRLHRLPATALVEVQGVLRRMYWRGAAGLASRTFVEVMALKRT